MKGLRRISMEKSGKLTPCPYTANVTWERCSQTLMQSLGLSQKVFADVVGVSKKTVEAWENGRNKPEGAARRLIGMMAKNKNIVQEIVHSR